MRIVKPSAHILPLDCKDPMSRIEQAGRVCYKSESKIKDGSAEVFVNGIIKRNHLAVLEHFIFVLEVSPNVAVSLLEANPKYIRITDPQQNGNERYIVSGSARGFIECYRRLQPYTSLGGQPRKDRVQHCLLQIMEAIVSHYHCRALFGGVPTGITENPTIRVLTMGDLNDVELRQHGWFTTVFTCDRGVSHEIVRHREASYCQESTRYCSYSRDQFGNEITVVQPADIAPYSDAWNTWVDSCQQSERSYFTMLKQGATPQQARAVLNNSLKTELFMTCYVDEWAHFFDLRDASPAHPNMREVAHLNHVEAAKALPTIFSVEKE